MRAREIIPFEYKMNHGLEYKMNHGPEVKNAIPNSVFFPYLFHFAFLCILPQTRGYMWEIPMGFPILSIRQSSAKFRQGSGGLQLTSYKELKI